VPSLKTAANLSAQKVLELFSNGRRRPRKSLEFSRSQSDVHWGGSINGRLKVDGHRLKCLKLAEELTTLHYDVLMDCASSFLNSTAMNIAAAPKDLADCCVQVFEVSKLPSLLGR